MDVIAIAISVGCFLLLLVIAFIVHRMAKRPKEEPVNFRPAPDVYKDMIRDAQAKHKAKGESAGIAPETVAVASVIAYGATSDSGSGGSYASGDGGGGGGGDGGGGF